MKYVHIGLTLCNFIFGLLYMENEPNIEDRLRRFKDYFESFNSPLDVCLPGLTITNINTSIDELENFGNNYLSRGLT